MLKAKAAAKAAEADLANTKLLAEIYQLNPLYYQLKIAETNASTIKETDKMIVVPEGTMPQLVLGKDIIPTVPIE